MNDHAAGAVQMYNKLVSTIQKNSKTGDQETEVSKFFFDSRVERVFANQKSDALKPMRNSDFRPDGMTALFDAVAEAIETIEKEDARDTAYSVIVVTDGGENESRNYPKSQPQKFSELLRLKRSTDFWTFAFMMPPEYIKDFLKVTKLPDGCVKAWTNINSAGDDAVAGLEYYFQERRAGKTKVDSLFIQTDLTNLKKSDLKTLEDVSSRVRIWKVDNKENNKKFVERHNEGVYTKGHLLYEVVEPEDVQDHKVMAIIPNNEPNKVLVGVRRHLGMPKTGTVRVKPGDHGDFRLFCQSTSPARNLDPNTLAIYFKDEEVMPEAE